MYYDRPSANWVQAFDSAQKEEERGRVLRDPMVGPRGELELSNFSLFT